jgi:hypothetical protein
MRRTCSRSNSLGGTSALTRPWPMKTAPVTRLSIVPAK